MRPLVVSIPFLLVMLASLAIIGGTWRYWKYSDDRRRRKSGLARDLLRPPGESCRQKIDDLTQKISTYLAFMLALPILGVAFYLGVTIAEPQQSTVVSLICVAPPFLLGLIVGVVKLFRTVDERQNWMLGLDGELSTAEDLNQLMLLGCRVFHDVPIDYGNIDHIVVSPSGVVCVDTKSRQKPIEGDDKARVEIDYGSGVMRFPDWTQKLPLEQSEMQARWLSNWLTSRCRQPVAVEPMIAIPGWDVRRTGKGIMVINPHKADRFFLNSRRVISDDLLARIADELTCLCRNMERVKGVKPHFRAGAVTAP